MPSKNTYVKRLKSKLIDIRYSDIPSKSKVSISLSELTKKAREVRKTFKDEDLARYNFA